MNDKATHTPEPWESAERGNHSTSIATVYTGGEGIGWIEIWAPAAFGASPETMFANAARIVACVNACVGMADPAEEIAALRAEAEAEGQRDQAKSLRDPTGVPFGAYMAESARLAARCAALEDGLTEIGDETTGGDSLAERLDWVRQRARALLAAATDQGARG